MIRLGAVGLVAAATVSMAQIRAPFKSDPPKMCDRCAGWNAAVEPFRVFGNTYYVGTQGLSSVLLTSDGGHILLDGALPESAERIDANLRALHFDLKDVKLIVNFTPTTTMPAASMRFRGRAGRPSQPARRARARSSAAKTRPTIRRTASATIRTSSRASLAYASSGTATCFASARSRSRRTSRLDTRPAARRGRGSHARAPAVSMSCTQTA